MALAMVASVAAPAPLRATTLGRASLDDLVAGNRTVVVGEVVDAHSYWNGDYNYILTDVRVKVYETLKGDVPDRELTITILGGRVDELTALVIGGPKLVPGNSYVLFLDEEDLPGVERALTVRDLCQGVFDIEMGRDGLRAVSQAKGHPLVPDYLGLVEVAGGPEGMPLTKMMQAIHGFVIQQRTRQEVQ
jgi:hypothetical protein